MDGKIAAAIRQSYRVARQAPNCRGRLVMRRVESVTRGVALPKQRSLTVCIATENAVERYCDRRYKLVREVLLVNSQSVVWRDPKRLVLPIVDSHNRDSVKNVHGSIRNLRIENGRLIGEVAWARGKSAQVVAQKWQDGHLSDFSISAEPLEIVEYQQWRGGGAADVVTRWTPIDASIVAAGADVGAR